MTHDIMNYVREHDMLEKGDGIVVGVSGGADSMCLLRFLLSVREEYELKLLVLHVNHGIRGESADRDEKFVEAFCTGNATAFRCVRADIPRLAAETGRTEEETGREVRYAAFSEACRELGYTKIAVAHNMDDNAETVLFNMFRGSGIAGIRGITPKRILTESADEAEAAGDGITIIRPLLGTTRAQIERILGEFGQEYCTDETNLGTDYCRNRIRNELLPYIRTNINSGVMEHIAELAEQARATELFLERITRDRIEEMKAQGSLKLIPCGRTGGRSGCGAEEGSRSTGCGGTGNEGCDVEFEAEGVCSLDTCLRRSVLRRLLIMAAGRMKDLESIHTKLVEDIAAGGTGRSASLPYGLRVENSYGRVRIRRTAGAYGHESGGTPSDVPAASSGRPENDRMSDVRTATDAVYITEADIPGEYELPDRSTLILRFAEKTEMGKIPKNTYTKWFDYDKICSNICVRTRRPGDYLLTAAKGGGELKRKQLNRYFIDTRTDRGDRDRTLLLAEGDHVLWVIGGRRDDSCLVTEETVRILTAEIKKV